MILLLSLTVPQTMPLLLVSTGSFYGFLFSIPGKSEGLGQVQGGVVQRQPMDGRPEIQRVALDSAIRVEAAKRVLAQMDREGPLPVRGVAVHRAGTAALLATAAQLPESPRCASTCSMVTCWRKNAKSTWGRTTGRRAA